MTIPEIILIVPYRNRAPQKKVFECVMPTILEDEKYKIFFIHQKDNRPFNRGAMKNIGFIYIKEKYPNDYKNMTLVFHDIDYLPYYKNQFNYKTQKNIVKHFFGYKHTLGGIFSINAEDFENINGFPNIWTWGLEDNVIQTRCRKANLIPDRSRFIQAGSQEDQVITLWHGWDRLINNKIFAKFKATSSIDGVTIIKNIKFDTKEISENIYIVNVTSFITGENHIVALQDASKKDSRKNLTFTYQNGGRVNPNKAPFIPTKNKSVFILGNIRR